MALSLNKPKLDNLAGEIWKSAERLRGKFKAYEYQSVILPIIVIRRLECVLLRWREEKKVEIRAKHAKPNYATNVGEAMWNMVKKRVRYEIILDREVENEN
jgi:type I restriction-modification system DNA methylase subunit